MKNIHVLPTEKPSRIRIGNNGNFVFGLTQNSITSKNDSYTNQHIYITSDEYIGLSYYLDGNLVRKGVIDDKEYWEVRKDYKKIILTTDQDLIKDGAQSIDDEFLEWFVKNPSCERIEVNGISDVALGGFADVYYKIIIPRTTQQIINEDYAGGLEMGQIPEKEEPKQEFPQPNIIDNWLKKNGDPEIDKQVEQEAKELCKQEKDYTALLQPVGTKQETLEEYIQSLFTNEDKDNKILFSSLIRSGAKWQQEQEKQQQDCFYEKALFVLENSPNNINTKKQLISWFKLFKKK
jgi:hypothetical protein